jgi:hypothetical protein
LPSAAKLSDLITPIQGTASHDPYSAPQWPYWGTQPQAHQLALVGNHSGDGRLTQPLALVDSGPNRQAQLQRGQDVISEWCKEFFMEVNVPKTEYADFKARNPAKSWLYIQR